MRITRAFSHAIQLGDFCPTCGLRLDSNLRLRATTFDSLTSLPDSEPIYHNLRYQNSSLESHSTLTSVTEYTLPEDTEQMDLADAFQRLATTLNETGRGQYEFKPPPFKGNPKEDIDTFLTKFDRFCELYNKDPDARLQIFPFFLQDTAYDIYNTFSDDIKNDYAQLTDELRLHFGQNELPIIESTRLYELTMKPTDTVTTFHDTIQKQCKRLDITNHQKMVLFVKGLPTHIKQFVLLQDPEHNYGGTSPGQNKRISG